LTSTPPVLAVVGAGFSGVMTALHLLRADPDVKVLLIERSRPIGLGAAYATLNPHHRLNVRAGNMSAWPDRPGDFVDWLDAQGLGVGSGGFATRGDYGRYLQGLLASVAQSHAAAQRLVILPDAIVELAPRDGGWRLVCALGQTLDADAVVLALGNPPPGGLAPVTAALAASPLYVADPWRWDPASLAGDDAAPVLLIGTGLTMVDIVLSLDDVAPGRPVLALSRRGLSPREHLGAPSSAPPPPPACDATPLQVLAWLRDQAARHGWRTAVDALRPCTQALWRAWTPRRRAAFLRHARPFWDAHRHRLAPSVAARLAALSAAGRLRIVAGKLDRLDLAGGGVDVVWRARGTQRREALRAGLVINCTGPGGDIAQAPDRLLRALAGAGLVRADPLRLGLDVDAAHRAIGADGAPHADLFAVGPITRGALWEINAVPDIRQQAVEVAATVLSAVQSSSAAAWISSDSLAIDGCGAGPTRRT
jgi:uncharacterized NAD(P)/FAD-binding protein YdhS